MIRTDFADWFSWARRVRRGSWIISGFAALRIGIPLDPAQFKASNDN